MHVVCVTHAYPRWSGDVAGAFIERLLLALRERSHTLTVVAPADEGRGGRENLRGIDVRRVRYATASRETLAYRGDMAETSRSGLGPLLAAALLAAQVGAVVEEARARRTELIHAHWWVPGGMVAWAACLAQHRRYVLTLHGTDVAILDKSRPARRLAQIVLRRAAVVTAVSNYLAQKAAAAVGMDPDAIVVQPMPLDVHRYARRSAGGAGVVTVGRLVQQKNLGVVLEAVAKLRESDDGMPLTVVGDGPERCALEHRAKQLGIAEATRFVGAVPPETIPDAIGDADVLAFPAVGEGLGLVAAEALMLGVPVVAARQGGGVTDIVPADGAGRLVDAADAGQMAQAIRDLKSDPDSRRKAAELGKVLKKRLDPSAVARVFENIYLRALRE